MEVLMCFLDSPFSACDVVHEMVLTDETQAECAREHGCQKHRACPLCRCFTDTSGLAECHPELPTLH